MKASPCTRLICPIVSPNPGSYFDDVITLSESIDSAKATEFRIHVSGRVNDKVDIQVYNILPKKIKDQINKKGVVLYEREKRPRGI